MVLKFGNPEQIKIVNRLQELEDFGDKQLNESLRELDSEKESLESEIEIIKEQKSQLKKSYELLKRLRNQEDLNEDQIREILILGDL